MSSPCSAILHRTNHANASCPLEPKGELPGDMPGVTRYPHPESNNTLKSKAPASGVPARLRVFCLTTMLSFSPELGELIGASFATQGSAALYGRMAYVTEGIWKRWQSSPDPKSGGYARATTLGHRPAPFPPDAGAQSTAKSRRGSNGSRESSVLSIGDFPVPENRRSREAQIWGPSRAQKIRRAQRRDDIHTRSSCLRNSSRTLEAGAVVAQSSSHGARRPGNGTAKWRRAQRPAIAGQSAPSRHMTVRPRSSGWPMNMHAHTPLVVGITDARTRELLRAR